MRKIMIELIHEDISTVPDENLPLLREAVILLSHLTPPWLEKSTLEEPLIELLSQSYQSDRNEYPLSDVSDGYTTAEFYDPRLE